MLGLLRLAIIYLVIINICTFLVFLWDKVRAQKGEWRVKESTILLMAALGGTPDIQPSLVGRVAPAACLG